jgi:trigger factor
MNVLEKMYGGNAFEDALNSHIQKKFSAAILEDKVAIASTPKYDLTSSEGEEFIFAVTFEVLPEVKLNDLTTLEIEKSKCDLTEANIEQTLKVLRKQKATYVEANQPAANNDKVKIDFVGTIDGQEFNGGSAHDYEFILGQNSMLPEFEAGIIGLNINEEKAVNVKFPENYHAAEFRNKDAVFKITLKAVKHEVLPELNDEFIKSIGVNDGLETTLRTEIKDNLGREINRRLNVKLRENTLNALLRANPIDTPHEMVHDEIHRMMENTEKRMKEHGYKPEQIKLTHDMFSADAKRLVTLRLLIQELIKEHKLTINDDDTKAIVTDLAANYDDKDEYVKWYYSDKARVENAKAMAMEHKVTKFITDQAKLTEVDVEYEKLMQEQI